MVLLGNLNLPFKTNIWFNAQIIILNGNIQPHTVAWILQMLQAIFGRNFWLPVPNNADLMPSDYHLLHICNTSSINKVWK